MQKNTVNVGVDNGSGIFQIQTHKAQFEMNNRIDEGRSISVDMKDDNSYNVIYKGKEYLVGAAANTPTCQVEGKGTENHLIALLTGLSQVIPSGHVVNIGTGESMNKYFDAEHKQTLISNFKGEHEIVVDGKNFKCTIQNIHVLPEGVGHKLLDPAKYKDKPSYTIDIGASTANFIFTAKGLVPDESSSFSFQLGMHKLISNIKTHLARKGYGINIQSSIIEDYIKNGSDIEEVQEIVDIESRKILDSLEIALQPDIDLNSKLIQEIEFVGGTSLCLKKYIKERYPKAVFIKNGTWSNVQGFAKFILAKYSR